MRKFETLLLLSPELAAESREGLLATMVGVVEREQGKMVTTDHWGMRDLAYPVKKQMRGYGGVISFEVACDLDTATRVVDGCRIPRIAPSLGGVESLIEQPALMSFYELTTEERLLVDLGKRIRDVRVGSDGNVYVLTDEDDGQLLRLLPPASK